MNKENNQFWGDNSNITHGANFKLWREQIKVIFCATNDTCDIECAKHSGIYN
jgi:hypothetical protein